MRTHYLIVIFLSLTVTSLSAQREGAKFNLYANYSQAVSNINRAWDEEVIHLRVMHRVNGFISLGLGTEIGLNGAEDKGSPLFASIQLSPFKKCRNMFFYTNTTILGPIYNETGLGYKLMFRKHFGLFANAGFNIKSKGYRQHIEFIHIDDDTVIPFSEYYDTTRYALALSFGFVF